MKAWIVYGDPCGDGWSVLVFAPTRNKARSMCVGRYWDEEYLDLTALRLPSMDGEMDIEAVLDDVSSDEKGLIEKSGIYKEEATR